jgi:hypothetical protein
MRGADFQIRSWLERRGCLARALDLFGASRAFHLAGAGAWEISKQCGRTALLRSRNSALRRWRGDRGGMWGWRGADFQIRSWFERRGCLARALDLFGGSRVFILWVQARGRFRSGASEPPCCGVGTPRSGAGAEIEAACGCGASFAMFQIQESRSTSHDRTSYCESKGSMFEILLAERLMILLGPA